LKTYKSVSIIVFIIVTILFADCCQATGGDFERKYQELINEDSRRGDFESAVAHASEACKIYDQEHKIEEKIGILKEMSLAYIALGQYGKALGVLNSALNIIDKTGNRELKATVLGIMGYASANTDAIEQGKKLLLEGLNLAKTDKDSKTIVNLLDYQAKVSIMLKGYPDAIAVCEEGIKMAEETDDARASAMLASDMATAYILQGNKKAAGEKLVYAYDNYQKMNDSHEKSYGLINFAKLSQKMAIMATDKGQSWISIACKALNQAEAIALSIGDYRSATYAYGYSGQLYENEQRYDEALQLTKKALFSARYIKAAEAAYLWEWQRARLYKALGQTDQAVAAYDQAVDTLNSIRQEMLACPGSGRQYSSRVTFEQIYFQQADLLLKRAELSQSNEKATSDIIKARSVIESLKTIELENYFQDPCIAEHQGARIKIEDVAADVMVVYSIIFKDRLVLLASGRFGIKMISTPVDSKKLTEEVKAFRLELEKPQQWLPTKEDKRRIVKLEGLIPSTYLTGAQTIYNWMFRPLEPEFALHKINKIIFIPDGILRTIPIAALHDGKQYLIEKMPLVTVPSLNLTDPSPLSHGKINALIVGISEGIHGFDPLDSVNEELEAVKNIYGGNILKNTDFNKKNLISALKERPYQIIHIATHGEFAQDIGDSYLLAWDGKIDMNQIDRFIRVTQYRKEPVELLTLSACKTAAGDGRAALGLAGVALKAGARSAVATLWNVSDQVASDIVIEFYRQLQNPSVSKAKALQQAQIKILHNTRFSHPFYWSPFLLIGNWL